MNLLSVKCIFKPIKRTFKQALCDNYEPLRPPRPKATIVASIFIELSLQILFKLCHDFTKLHYEFWVTW